MLDKVEGRSSNGGLEKGGAGGGGRQGGAKAHQQDYSSEISYVDARVRNVRNRSVLKRDPYRVARCCYSTSTRTGTEFVRQHQGVEPRVFHAPRLESEYESMSSETSYCIRFVVNVWRSPRLHMITRDTRPWI